MFYSAGLLATAAFAALAAAQNTTGTSLTINIGSVDTVLRQQWCLGQTNNCPVLCGGSANPNSCDPTTLEYTCTCTNGAQPNISDYADTVPSYICGEYIKECVASHPNDLTGITNCRAIKCGDKNASALASGSDSSSSMTASMTSTASGVGASASSASGSASSRTSAAGSSATSAAAAATSSAAAAIVNVATNYGTGILATALLAVFGLAL